jgi:ubiquinone/menaquinone biosynthesis C-methylase UbiE
MGLVRQAVAGERHVCPTWFAAPLGTSLRRLLHRPERILGPFIGAGDTALDLGCGPGFFTEAMARLVGPQGRVIAADLEPGMLDRTRRRLEGTGVADRVRFQACTEDAIGLDTTLDFALAFWMLHEVPAADRTLAEVFAHLRPGGRLLLAEPRLHVSRSRFDAQVATAIAAGFIRTGAPAIGVSRSALLARPSGTLPPSA